MSQAGNIYDLYYFKGQVSIGKGIDQYADPSAWFEVGADGTNKGLLLPRVANTASIALPKAGLFVYDKSDKKIKYYDGTAWVEAGGGGGATDNPAYIWNQTATLQTANFRINTGTFELAAGHKTTIDATTYTTTIQYAGLAEPQKRVFQINATVASNGSRVEFHAAKNDGTFPNVFEIDGSNTIVSVFGNFVTSGTANINGVLYANATLSARAGSGGTSITVNINDTSSNLGIWFNGVTNDFRGFIGVWAANAPFWSNWKDKFIVSSSGGNLHFGTGGDTTQVILYTSGVLGTCPLASPPTVVNGGLYYSTSLNKEQLGIAGNWKNIATEDSAVVTGHTIYVDKDAPTATDTRTGISKYSQSVPFKTIQAAISSLATAANDTVIVNGGTYTENVSIAIGYMNLIIKLMNGTVLNGSLMQTIDQNSITLILLENSVINGKVGQPYNMGGAWRINGDKTGKIITSNLLIESNVLEIRGLDILNTGTGTIHGYYDVIVENCNTVTGNPTGQFGRNAIINNVNTITYTGTCQGQTFMRNVKKCIDIQYVYATEAYLNADDVNFEFTVNPDWSMMFKTNIKNCTFLAPNGLTGFTNNPNNYYLFDNCQFEFTNATTNALTITPAAGTVVIVKNCIANSVSLINTHAQIKEFNNYTDPKFKTFKTF